MHCMHLTIPEISFFFYFVHFTTMAKVVVYIICAAACVTIRDIVFFLSVFHLLLIEKSIF